VYLHGADVRFLYRIIQILLSKKKLPFACKQTGNILLYVKVFFASCKSQIPKPNSPNTARKFLKQPPKSGYFYRKK